MKKKSLINYKLFQRRKNFNPLSIFSKDKDTTYEDFVSFLNSKMVDTPGLEYFLRVKEEFTKRTQAAKQIATVVKEEVEKIETSRQKRRAKRSKKPVVKDEVQEKTVEEPLTTEVKSDEKNSTE